MAASDHNLSLARAFLEEAKKRARIESKKKNLELLWTALQETRNEGQAKYAIKEIGEKLAKLGGMKTQSIRNDTGGDYSRLIALFREADRNHRGVDSPPLERGIALISDESIRASVKAVLGENKRLKLENDRLRELCGDVIIPLNPCSAQTATSALVMKNYLTPRYRESLLKGILEERLAERGLTINEDGSISQGDSLLFPPAFATAIKAILAADSEHK